MNKSRCANCGRKAKMHLTAETKEGTRVQIYACDKCEKILEGRLRALHDGKVPS